MRIEKGQQLFEESGLDALLIDHPTDLFYLTGERLSFGKFIFSKEGPKLYADGRYFEEVKEKAPCSVHLYERGNFEEEFFREGKRIGFDSECTSYASFQKIEKFGVIPVPVPSPLRDLRAIKDSDEIVKLKKAAQLTWRGFEYISSLLKVGVTEKEIAEAFEIYVLKHGGEGLAFDPIIAFGKNTSFPHYHPKDVPLCENDIVLMDLGAKVEGYSGDMTRVLFFGEAMKEQERLLALVKKAHGRALALCKPGVKVGQLDQAAREVFQEEGMEDAFSHSLGHGIGLDTHEFPLIRKTGPDKNVVLKAGMVITIEPGLYLPGIGGARYEDMLCITKEGHERFF